MSTVPALRALLALLLLAAVGLGACSRTPTEVYVDMTTAAQMGDREGFLAGFTAESRDLVHALIDLSEAYGMEDSNPYELLVYDTVEDEQVDGDRAILTVSRRGRSARLLLVKEDGDWRIDTAALEAFWNEEGRR